MRRRLSIYIQNCIICLENGQKNLDASSELKSKLTVKVADNCLCQASNKVDRRQI
jgi:hypothetical protein